MEKMINEVEDYPEGFEGTFYFTNDTDEDFITPWNNKNYTYPAEKTTPMIITDEPPERVQQIRKMFAKRLAEREYFKSKNFDNIKNGVKTDRHEKIVIPSMYNEEVLQPWIDSCLKPLPKGKQKISKVEVDKAPKGGSKAFSTGNPENLFPKDVDLSQEFVEENRKMLKS